MSRPLPIAVVQAPPLTMRPATKELGTQIRSVLSTFPNTRLMIFPELHLHGAPNGGTVSDDQLCAEAQSLDGNRIQELRQLAASFGVWLVPGTVCEPDGTGGVFNTAIAFSPEGDLRAAYRKCFPWRPYEFFTPGKQFVTFDIDGLGRVGLSICYDMWFPEVARHLAWMGAEIIISPAQTTTCDREQEVVLTRAAAIANQVFVVSSNAATPIGTGRSLIVDPEGRVRTQAGESSVVLTDVIDLDEVSRVRQFGTVGLNRLWSQFTEQDTPLELPLYEGRIEPRRWQPGTYTSVAPVEHSQGGGYF